MEFENTDFAKIKEIVSKIFDGKSKISIAVMLGILGLFVIGFSNIFKGFNRSEVIKTNASITMENRQEKMQSSLESIISTIEGAGKAKVMVTFENSAETVYAAEERKNKEASEDKTGGEVTRKKESDDCEKKYITVKDSEGTEHALAVTEIEPKVKGVIVICTGGDDPVVKLRITEAITAALNIPSKRVCVTKSEKNL